MYYFEALLKVESGLCRTDNMVKNRWHQKLKHEVRAEGRKRRASEDESLQAGTSSSSFLTPLKLPYL